MNKTVGGQSQPLCKAEFLFQWYICLQEDVTALSDMGINCVKICLDIFNIFSVHEMNKICSEWKSIITGHFTQKLSLFKKDNMKSHFMARSCIS